MRIVAATTAAERAWWKEAVFYQVYPRSFADGNGDGIGDLTGLIERLDYLADLGIDAIWLSPHYPSPQVDLGYDVSDFVGVHPDYGTLDDFRTLLDAAHDARHPGRHRPRPQPHVGSAPLVHRVAVEPGQRQAGLVRLARPARRGPAQQLDVAVRGIRLGARRDDRPVLLPLLPARATGPELSAIRP